VATGRSGEDNLNGSYADGLEKCALDSVVDSPVPKLISTCSSNRDVY